MSHQSLASLLNELSRKGQALIKEGNTTVIVSDLSAENARLIRTAALTSAWPFTIHDSANSESDLDHGDEAFGPFRVELEKPLPEGYVQAEALYVATEVGFNAFLDRGHVAPRWHVLGLTKPFNTRARGYSDWSIEEPYVESPATKSPRLLVKESATVRTVPEDVRHWLLAEGHSLDELDPLHVAWAVHAFDALSRCLANEIDTAGSKLTFKGPPKLNLTITRAVGDEPPIPLKDFEVVQEAAVWVFDNAREAEVKHILLSAEIARSGRADGEVLQYFKENLAAALDCAKIAYQMAVSEITKDTLKSLGDLRKAVTEETSKATDATRQAIAAISTALTVGLGLIVARLTLQINPYLISIVMAVAFGYTVLNVMSGRKFINIQRTLRQDWQPKLYRFLSEAEFKKMVGEPIEEAEGLFYKVSRRGLAMLGFAALGIAIFAFAYSAPSPVTTAPVLAPPVVAPASPQPLPRDQLPQPQPQHDVIPQLSPESEERPPSKPSKKEENPVRFDQGIFAVRSDIACLGREA
ncbi:hypothetical protein PS623_03982 [Pseudomonas fluorescens]|uniref:hypothetical protein n=1 Tax=Pseudomonas fluorescens TaxID=294 RepID=UPI0012402E43|nr:hypothetical protein [Pseudomonas fluorescens]VVN14841.1 hypothetical protein PS623_03982 [Pseudomonas fluorescens]